jgi:hypothetical protein
MVLERLPNHKRIRLIILDQQDQESLTHRPD